MPSIASILFTAALLSNLVSAQQENGPCVKACPPKSSFCDGDETGAALDQCRCASFTLTGDPLITCVQQCPVEEQLIFANNLPDLCNSLLFPNLDLDSSTTSSATAVNTVSSASGPQETATATPTASTASRSASTSATGSAGSATATAAGNGGVDSLSIPLGALGYMAYAAGLVAWL